MQTVSLCENISSPSIGSEGRRPYFFEKTKTLIFMTKNKSKTRFFQTNMTPPPLWDARDFVPQFISTSARFPQEMIAAEFFISSGTGPLEKTS